LRRLFTAAMVRDAFAVAYTRKINFIKFDLYATSNHTS